MSARKVPSAETGTESSTTGETIRFKTYSPPIISAGGPFIFYCECEGMCLECGRPRVRR